QKGAAEGPRPLAPVSTAVCSDTPELSWDPVPGATGYLVSLYDDRSPEAVEEVPVKATRWRLSSRLDRGAVYRWEITATTDHGEVKGTPARFCVLSTEELRAY